jgi:fumarate reductase flavoprotein subunit
LITTVDGQITGVTARGQDGAKLDYQARNVLLASGGAGGDPAMFEKLNGAPLYCRWAYPYNKGAGVTLGESVGGYVRGVENYLCNDGAILSDMAYPSPVSASAVTDSAKRQPWEIYVNVNGERFGQEAHPSVDVREHNVLKQPGHRYWIVFDDQILDQAPPLIAGWDRDAIRRAFGKHHMFARGDSLLELAKWAGVDADGLQRSVAAYNAGQSSGEDGFGRTHTPLPIARPPFYAVRVQGFSILTYGGLAVDQTLRVQRGDGSVVPNLYAAGEVLGKGSLSGQAYVGGMSLTPALTFGRLIAQRIALPV